MTKKTKQQRELTKRDLAFYVAVILLLGPLGVVIVLYDYHRYIKKT